MERRDNLALSMTKIVTAFSEKNYLVASFDSFELDSSKHNKYDVSYLTHSLLFTTYPPNVPEPEPYTLDDALAVANDPNVLKLYEPPFVVYISSFNERPAMFVESHAASSLIVYMVNMVSLEETRIVIKEGEGCDPIIVDVKEVIEKCALPEKHVYDCNKCLTVATTLEHSCIIRRTLAADNPRFEAFSPKSLEQHLDMTSNPSYYYSTNGNSKLIPRDLHSIPSSGKVELPYKSSSTMMANHLYISPVMFSGGKRSTRKVSPAFVGIRDVTIDDIDFSFYEKNLEAKQDAASERQRIAKRVKAICSNCAVKDECHTHYPYKKRYCEGSYPSYETISKEILERYYRCNEKENFTKETLVEILIKSEEREVYNKKTNKRVRGYLGLSMDHNLQLTFVVHRTSNEEVIFVGKTDEDWRRFKELNNIDTSEISSYAKENILNWLSTPDKFALLLAATNIKYSPSLVCGWHKTTYKAVYVQILYNRIDVIFHRPSQKTRLYWELSIEDWGSFFRHYGSIPAYR